MNATLAGLLIALFASAPAAEQAPPGDLGLLQGTWEARAGSRGEIGVVLNVRAREFEVEIAMPAGLELSVRGEIRVDENRSPRALDWVKLTLLDGQELPDTLAIYRLEGDTLTLRNGGPSNPRPDDFRPGEGVLSDTVVFKRRPAEGR